MKVQLLHNQDCHTWEKLLAELRGMGLEPEVILVNDDTEAQKYHFSGSPQLLVDGKDIDPMAEKITSYQVGGCRIYSWQGKIYEYPPKEMIMVALGKGK